MKSPMHLGPLISMSRSARFKERLHRLAGRALRGVYRSRGAALGALCALFAVSMTIGIALVMTSLLTQTLGESYASHFIPRWALSVVSALNALSPQGAWRLSWPCLWLFLLFGVGALGMGLSVYGLIFVFDRAGVEAIACEEKAQFLGVKAVSMGEAIALEADICPGAARSGAKRL